MNQHIEQFFLDPDIPIIKAMQLIQEKGLGVGFVVDKNGKLIGTVTDGDIRRAILQGKMPDTATVKEVMHEDPIVLRHAGDMPQEGLQTRIKERFGEGGVLKIPVVDEEGRPQEIVTAVLHGSQASLVLPEGKEKELSSDLRSILIVGGAGYIGSVLARELLQKGYKVRVFDNLTYGDAGIIQLMNEKNFQFLKGDIRDISAVVEAIKDMDAVIHLAALVGDEASKINPQKTIEINYLATKALAEACKYSQINRFLFASSCSVYGASLDPETKLKEDSILNPVSLYAQTKLKSEQGLQELADENFSPVILRLATVYGYSPRMRFDLAINTFIGQAIFEHKLKVFGGRQWRPFVHVKDAAHALLTCLEAPLQKVKNQVFNMGSDEQNYQIEHLSHLIQSLIPQTAIEKLPSMGDLRNYNVSFEKASAKLGFQAKFTVSDAIAEIQKAVQSGALDHYRQPQYSDYESLLYASH